MNQEEASSQENPNEYYQKFVQCFVKEMDSDGKGCIELEVRYAALVLQMTVQDLHRGFKPGPLLRDKVYQVSEAMEDQIARDAFETFLIHSLFVSLLLSFLWFMLTESSERIWRHSKRLINLPTSSKREVSPLLRSFSIPRSAP